MKPSSRCERHFQVAGVTVAVKSDLDLDGIRFKPELTSFAVNEPGDDQVVLRHHFELPDLQSLVLGEELYHKPPWIISHSAVHDTWVYRTIPHDGAASWHRVAVFDAEHTHGTIYSPPSMVERLRRSGWDSLSLFTTDQIWLVRVLADRHAVLLHSAAAILNGRGLLFVGHSDAGKSTTVTLLKAAQARDRGQRPLDVEILCDDRNVVRRWALGSDGSEDPRGSWEYRVHGTWSHGDVADVSPASAPLAAILFLQQDTRNELVRLANRREIWKRLLAPLARSLVTAPWWEKELDTLEHIVSDVPCYIMRFDKSGGIVDHLTRL